MLTCQTSLYRLEFVDPTTKRCPHRLPECVMSHIAERFSHPSRSAAQRNEIWARKACNKCLSKLSGSIEDAAGRSFSMDKATAHHEKKAPLHEPASY
jgi:hypothetical protein